ncbi:MAG: autotransporter outer membrane beta-barrel domain-containing protein [Parvibaculaceae bacterium]
MGGQRPSGDRRLDGTIGGLLRRRLAFTTILAVAPLLGYGRQAHADCVASPSPTFVCSGANGTTQSIPVDNADVSTAADFSVNAAGGAGIVITGAGDVRFTDTHAETDIRAADDALFVQATDDDGLTPGSVTVLTDGRLTGGSRGIAAYNDGIGALAITVNGEVEGQAGDGIYARNNAGTGLTIVTGAESMVTGTGSGVAAVNYEGILEITVDGEVGGTYGSGISAENFDGATDLTVTTRAGSAVTGAYGISTANGGSGDMTVTADGSVGGTGGHGIRASNSGGSLTIDTGTQSSVVGSARGIAAYNYGSGTLEITADGEVEGQGGDGIYARNNAGTGLTIVTGAESAVTGTGSGIAAVNYGGDLEITANDQVGGTYGSGIFAYNGGGGDLTVTTRAGSAVTGAYGISAANGGSGDMTVTAGGSVGGADGFGIRASNGGGGLTVDTGARSSIVGSTTGIAAYNYGGGDLEITTDGEVEGQGGDGIYARNEGASLKIVTGAESSVAGSSRGISAVNYRGNLEITVDGEASGTESYGISAENFSGAEALTIRTGAGSTVAGISGIRARNDGSGDLAITANGAVTGSTYHGIVAYNGGDGNLTVTTGTNSAVSGNYDGINAGNEGDGDLIITANGTVAGDLDGIDAENGGAGDTEITVSGSVTGRGADAFDGSGIEADSDGEITVTVNGSGLVQGDHAGIAAASHEGQAISISNGGIVRNLSGASDALAIAAIGGAAGIENTGRLVGFVTLDTVDDFDDELKNTGSWNMAGGTSDFGGGDDKVENGGTLRAAGDGTTIETTTLGNLESFANSGLITLVDGQEGDSLFFTGASATEFAGAGGRLAVDAFLGPAGEGKSDQLTIDGNVTGTTRVSVNVVGSSGTNSDGIPVITVAGTTAEEDFDLEGGVLNAGFFAWDLRLDGNTHELYTSGLGAGSYEFAAGITGAQDIWYQTAGTLLQRQADLRALLSGTAVTPVADFSEPVEPQPLASVTPGLWLKGVGAWLDRDAQEDGLDLDRDQEIYGIFGGFDFGTDNLAGRGDVLMFGLLAGYIHSDLDFDATGTRWRYEGPSVGAYATYLNRAFHADLLVKADFLDVDIDAGAIAPGEDDADTDVFNIGGRLDAGYKIGMGAGMFIEPQATLAVLNTEVDDIGDIFGGAVAFDDETSVRGRLGLRLGHEQVTASQVVYSADVTGSVWQEFMGDNDATIFAPDMPAAGVSDDPGETFGDVSVGFSMAAPEGWSGFARADWTFNEDFDALSANAGVRYSW